MIFYFLNNYTPVPNRTIRSIKVWGRSWKFFCNIKSVDFLQFQRDFIPQAKLVEAFNKR